MPASDEEPNRWRTTRELPAWGATLGLHAAVLVAFAFWSFPVLRETFKELVVSSEVEEPVEPEFKFDVAATDHIGNGGDGDSLTPSLAAASQLTPSPQQQTSRKLQEELVKVDVAPAATISEVNTDAQIGRAHV